MPSSSLMLVCMSWSNYASIYFLNSKAFRSHFFQGKTNRDIMSRATDDTLQLQTGLIKVVDSLFKEPATLIAAGSYLIYVAFQNSNIVSLFIVLVSVPACVIPIKFVGKRFVRRAGKAQTEAGQISHVLNENLAATRSCWFTLAQGRWRSCLTSLPTMRGSCSLGVVASASSSGEQRHALQVKLSLSGFSCENAEMATLP